MPMYDPKTPEQYVELLDQAIFEVGELIACARDEGEDDPEFSRQLPVYERLARELKQLRADILEGRHEFGDGADLPFMEALRQARVSVPFMPLLAGLNAAHKTGLKQ